jgi:hypothetical protein
VEKETSRSESSAGTALAILIAIVTVITAVVAWRASLLDDGAGDADFDGLLSTVNVEETQALNRVNAYENYGAYTRYWKYDELAFLLEEDLERADEAEYDLLLDQVQDYNDLALVSEDFFPSRFLTRDGRYDIKRQLSEMWADASREKDLTADAWFAEADSLRRRMVYMVGAGAILALALVFYTLVESMERDWRYSRFALAIGTVLSAVGIVLAVLIDMNKL